MSDEYQAQDHFDDVVVEYAASPDKAGCGCLGCTSLLVIFVLTFAAVILFKAPVRAWTSEDSFRRLTKR